MSYAISRVEDNRLLLRDSIRSFVKNKVEPGAKSVDAESRISPRIYQDLVDADFHAIVVPSIYGGSGALITDGVIVIEEVARASGAVASILGMNLAGTEALVTSPNGSLRDSILHRVATGEVIAIMSLDDWAMPNALHATVSGEQFVLSGTLHWVPDYEVDANLLLIARATSESGDQLFALDVGALVRKGAIEFGPLESDLGLRGMALKSLTFENVEVNGDTLIAPGGDGRARGRHSQAAIHLAIAAQANGIATAALGHAHDYADERRQFGVPIIDFQSTRTILGKMAAKLEAARQLLLAAAGELDSVKQTGRSDMSLTIDAAAKGYSTDMAVEITIDAVQIFGGYGFVKDYPVERLMRDAKMTQLLAGTDQWLDVILKLPWA